MALTKVSTGMLSADAASVDLNIDAGTMFIDASANRVGIGNTSPATALDVTGTVTADGLTVQTTNGLGALLESTGTSYQYLQFKNTGETNNFIGFVNDDFVVSPANVQKLILTAEGNVGIGTSSPSFGLSVESDNGSGYAALFRKSSSDPALTIQTTSSITQIQGLNSGLTATNDIAMQLSGGNVGIGNTPSSFYTGSNNLVVGTGVGEEGITIYGGASNTSYLLFADGTSGAATYAGQVNYNHSTNALNLCTNGNTTPRMVVDSSGNVGIGTTSPSSYYSTKLVVSVPDENGITIVSDPAHQAYLMFADGTTSNNQYRGYIGFDHATDLMQMTSFGETKFVVNGTTEAMRIDSSGNLLVGSPTPTTKLTVNGQGAFGSENASGNGIYLYVSGALSDNSYMSRSSAGTGTTTWYIGNQSITTSSDLRLKDNIVDSQRNAVEIINNLRVVDHTWNDPSDQSINNKNSRGIWTGLIAQEAVEHIPWLVNRPSEDVDENGNNNYWHMDYGYAVPLLMKAIQEQQDLIESLTARIAALEGAN